MTTATGSISSAGIGSGLDVSSIVSSLMAVETQPLTKLQTVASTMQTKLSAFGQMQSFVSSFRDAAAQLQTASNYAVTTATSSDTTSVGASSTMPPGPPSCPAWAAWAAITFHSNVPTTTRTSTATRNGITRTPPASSTSPAADAPRTGHPPRYRSDRKSA